MTDQRPILALERRGRMVRAELSCLNQESAVELFDELLAAAKRTGLVVVRVNERED